MKASLFTLALSMVALAGAVSHSEARTPARVNHLAIMEGTPKKLSEFRFFFRPRAQQSLGATPYELNTPLYSDGAAKLRFAYVPPGKQAIANGEGLLEFPVGSALIKTFAFGEGSDRRLIETRVLLHREKGWVALPYKWNDEQTDATLALAGARIPVTGSDGSEISYRIPNKNQCKQCHSIDDAVMPIGPKARNLSREWLMEQMRDGRLDRVPDRADSMPVWERPDHDETRLFELDSYARAYLDVNCAHCHQPQGKASNSGLDLRWEQGDETALGIRKRPISAGQGSGGYNFSVAPGDPDRSIMVHRMGSTKPGVAMPELGKSTVDEDGLAIIREWIAKMPTQ